MHRRGGQGEVHRAAQRRRQRKRSNSIAAEIAFSSLVDLLQFLAKLHLMDYSLLVGIHDCALAEEEALQNENASRDAGAGGRETSESEECESGER